MKAFKRIKKNLGLLVEGPVYLGVAGLIMVLLASITAGVQSGQVTGASGCNATSIVRCGYDYNASAYSLQGLNATATQFPNIGIVIAMAVILGLIFIYVLGKIQHQVG
jgi:hypothetical protein